MKNIQKNLIFQVFFILGFSLALSSSVLAAPQEVQVIKINTTSGNPTLQTNPASSISETSATLNGFFNTNQAETTVWFEYGTSPSFGQTTPTETHAANTSGEYSASITVTPGSTIYFEAFGINSSGPGYGVALSFTVPNYPAATVQTNPASSVSQTSATLNGFFNGNTGTVSTYFEYGTSSSLGQETSQASQSTSYGDFSETISTSPNTTYYFRADAVNAAGQVVSGTILNFNTSGSTGGGGGTNAPTVSTYSATNVSSNQALLNGYVDPSGATASVYFLWGTNSGDLSNTLTAGSESTATTFSAWLNNLSINTTYFFEACAQDSFGQNCGSVSSFYTNQNGGGGSNSAPTVTTQSATNLNNGSATLNGSAYSNSNLTTCWFLWGSNSNPTQYLSSNCNNTTNTQFSQLLSGLSSNITYYDEACAENSYGQNCGQVVPFSVGNTGNYYYPPTNYPPQTQYYPQPVLATYTGYVPSQPPVVEQPQVETIITHFGSSDTSEVSLSIRSNASSTATLSNTLVYTITYKNISSSQLSDAILRIGLPTDFTFISASQGIYSNSDNSVIVSLNTLLAHETDTITITGNVTKAKVGDTILVSGTLSYILPLNDARKSATAYNSLTINNTNSSLLGLTLASGGFFPHTILGWLILIAVIYIVILLATRFYDERKRT